MSGGSGFAGYRIPAVEACRMMGWETGAFLEAESWSRSREVVEIRERDVKLKWVTVPSSQSLGSTERVKSFPTDVCARNAPFSYSLLQLQHMYWSAYNFPETASWMPLSGLTEEIGEVYGVSDGDRDKYLDGLSDAMIFLCAYCSQMKFNLSEIVGTPGEVPPDTGLCSDSIKQMSILIGRVHHHHLKIALGIRMAEDHRSEIARNLRLIVVALQIMASNWNADLLVAVETTWKKVRSRNWIKYPERGVA